MAIRKRLKKAYEALALVLGNSEVTQDSEAAHGAAHEENRQ